jgi:hypothetical protein
VVKNIAVISTLGPNRPRSHLHTDTATLVAAISAAGMYRFVGVNGGGIDVPGDRRSTSAKIVSELIQTLRGAVVKDQPAEYAVYAASSLDRALVRPPRLVEGPPTGRLEA